MASHMENENVNENEIENDIENAVERAENPEIFFVGKCAISVDRKRAKERNSPHLSMKCQMASILF